MKKKYEIEGMHCQGCVDRVTALALEAGALSTVVNLNKGYSIVDSGMSFREEDYLRAMELSGFSAKEARMNEGDEIKEISEIEQPSTEEE